MIYRAAYVLPMDGSIIENGEVLVHEGKIGAVGRDLATAHPEERIRETGRCAILPGFVNAHSHVDNTMSRHVCDGQNLWDFLESMGFGLGRRTPDYELFLASAMLGAAECARSGITCLADCTFSGAAAQALKETGLRGVVYKEIFGQSFGSDYARRFSLALEDVAKMQAQTSPLVRIGISPHSVYTSNSDVLKLCAKSCANLGIPVSIHLAETAAETQYTMAGTGPIAEMRSRLGREPMTSGLTPARLMFESGLMREGTCLAHCVHVSDDELELIASSGAGVAHCPRSNALLGCGIAPATQFFRSGAKLGLGTDGAATCGRIDMFQEMLFTLAVQRAAAEDASVLSARDVLQMATIGGARALGLDQEIGSLEVGKRADLIAVDLGELMENESVEAAILDRRSSDVVFSVVDGEEIVENGRLAEIDVGEYAARLNDGLRSLGLA